MPPFWIWSSDCQVIEPGRPVRLAERVAAVMAQVLGWHLGERHRQVASPFIGPLFREEEIALFHEALDVILRRVAGFQFRDFREELVLQRRPGRRHRRDGQTDDHLVGR
jgi:hypothetical protein